MNNLTTFFAVTATLFFWYISSMPYYYLLARKTTLPIYLAPTSPQDPIWLIVHSIIGYSTLERWLPSFIWNRVKITISGWEYHCRHEVMDSLGLNFVLVTPHGMMIFVADPEVANTILTRRKDFGRVDLAAKMIGLFGPNLFSVGEDEWQRHRRIVAPKLNERIMKAVWDESLAQTEDMLAQVSKSTKLGEFGRSDTTLSDMKTITINVIGSVGFGKTQSFSGATREEPPPGFRTTSMASVRTIVESLFLGLLIPARYLMLPFMPAHVQQVGVSQIEYPLHLKAIIAQERLNASSNSSLLASLVELANANRGLAEKSTRNHLSAEEITGNLFVFTVAGFDTTANTLMYGVLMLALHPEWQEWIYENIDTVTKLHPNGGYASKFSLLTRILAFMFETLRCCTPITALSKTINNSQTIHNIHFPGGGLVSVIAGVIHSSSTIWGPDSLEFRPTRWLEGVGRPGFEALIEPGRGTFMPWSLGPRNCPGAKMAQVEFVSVISAIFREWRVEPARHKNESTEDARHRLGQTMADSRHGLTMQLARPQDAVLKWIKR